MVTQFSIDGTIMRPDLMEPLPFPWVGINVPGLEFNPPLDPASNLDLMVAYYVSKGCTMLRLPFKWEHLQATTGGSLIMAYANRIKAAVDAITGAGMWCLLDCHNYAKYNNIQLNLGGNPGFAHLADMWKKLIEFLDNPKVVVDTMNEPVNITAANSGVMTQVVLDELRGIGYIGWLMYEGGNSFSHTASWVSDGNGTAFLNLNDPLSKLIANGHSYINQANNDSDSTAVTGAGVSRLTPFTNWGVSNGVYLALTETGHANNAPHFTEHEARLSHIEANSFLQKPAGGYVCWQYWAGGRTSDTYKFQMEPSSLVTPVDKPQWATLDNHMVWS